MQVRHPREGDVLPIPLEFQHFDPAWVWIYGNAILIAAPAHDAVLLLRLVRFGEMPPLWTHRLFQQVIKESRERGFHRYMTWLSSEVAEERQLYKIAARHGAVFESFRGHLVGGVI
jgi:hypothetical protein